MQTKLKNIMSSKKGFTLIELLVVIGILAVLAAIAIPSVAGLIDRANVSADKTNSNEMTNALERFTSEYELYCQDIASGAVKDGQTSGFDSAQGRVYNVLKATNRHEVGVVEGTVVDADSDVTARLNRDTKYAADEATMKAIVQNYTKTSSSTFEPKQSDCHFWYSPECGLVVCAPANAIVSELNDLVISGMTATGATLADDGSNVTWINLTTEATGTADNAKVSRS